jgi:hypothetical protein
MKSEVEEQAQKCEVKADDSSMSIIGLPGCLNNFRIESNKWIDGALGRLVVDVLFPSKGRGALESWATKVKKPILK